jgi:hypothetical protein
MALVEEEDLKAMLKDASIGNWITRGAWAEAIIKETAPSSDSKSSYEEFRAALAASVGQTDGS